jgi:tRNA modification GTPase
MSKTIFALATGNEISALSVIRISGKECKKILKTLTLKSEPKDKALVLRKFYNPQNKKEIIDHCLMAWMPGPKSYTGEDSLEIYCHGGQAVFKSFFDTLINFKDVVYAEQGEFSKRAIINGKINLIEAEAINDLINARTEKQRLLAARQYDGGLSIPLRDWREKLIECMSIIEANIDFSDEEDAPNFINIEKQLESLIHAIRKALKDNENYELLKEGTKVVLTGCPNVGKSSLFNTMIRREKAIVTDIAGTTRDIIESKINLKGYPVVIYDTAGITISNDRVEQEGIKKAKEVIKEADIVLNVYDTENYKERVIKNSKWDVLNKIDKMSKGMKVVSSTNLVSAKSGEGIEELLNKIYEEILKKTKHLYSTNAIISNSRQASELEAALSSIVEARGEKAPEILSEHLRQANRSLERILGNIDIEEVLGSIFSKFCIGK